MYDGDEAGRYDNVHGDEDYNDYEALQLKYDRADLEYDDYEVYEHE